MQVVGEGVFLKVSLILREICNHLSCVECLLELLTMPQVFIRYTLQAEVSKKLSDESREAFGEKCSLSFLFRFVLAVWC